MRRRTQDERARTAHTLNFNIDVLPGTAADKCKYMLIHVRFLEADEVRRELYAAPQLVVSHSFEGSATNGSGHFHKALLFTHA